MDDVLERIAAWQAAGLIDAATATRLRTAEATLPAGPARAVGPDEPAGAWSGLSFFGPTPTIVEVFAYLGAGFFLGAWSAFLARLADTGAREAILTAGTALGAAILVGLALVLRRGDVRHRRGAGVALLVAAAVAAAAADFFGQLIHLDSRPVAQLIDAGAALAVAALGRRLLPSLTTQLAVVGAVTGLGAAILGLLEPVISGAPCCISTPQPPDDLLRVVILPAAGWLLIALGLGLLGLREARSGTAPALRRASLTRFWAGIVAVIGLSTSVFRSGLLSNDQYGRLLEPWLGDVVVLALAAVLLERAIRRGAVAYIVVAAIALVTALTDFNFSYLSESRDVGLVVEGAILLAVGFGADRLRRRLDRPRGDPPATTEPEALAA